MGSNAMRGTIAIAAVAFMGACHTPQKANGGDAGIATGEGGTVSVDDLPKAKQTAEEALHAYWKDAPVKLTEEPFNRSLDRRNRTSKHDAGPLPGDDVIDLAIVAVRLTDPMSFMQQAAPGIVPSLRIAFDGTKADHVMFVAVLGNKADAGTKPLPGVFVSIERKSAAALTADFDPTKIASVVPERRDDDISLEHAFDEEFIDIASTQHAAWKAWNTAEPREMSILAVEKSCQDVEDDRLPDGATMPALASTDLLMADQPSMSSRSARWSSFYIAAAGGHVDFLCECDLVSDRCWTKAK